MYVKNHRSGDSWLPGEIDKATGPVSYTVRMAGGDTIRCHQDHIRSRIAKEPQSGTLPIEDIDDIASQTSEDPSQLGFDVSPAVTCESVAETTEHERAQESLLPSTMNEIPVGTAPNATEPQEKQDTRSTRVYPRRYRHPPQYYGT